MSKKNPEAQAPDQGKVAQQNLAAMQATLPGAAQLNYDINANPNYGTLANTQLQENVRNQVFSGEADVKNQLLQNILQSLISPTGATQQQQEAQNAIRQRETNNLQKAVRERANLGGNLFSGNASLQEGRALTELGQGYAASDINADEVRRQNAINAALPALQLLFPQAQIVNPQYINPVPSANTAYQGQYGANMANAQFQQQQANNQSALLQSLLSAAGTVAGAAVGGPAGAAVGSQAGKVAGGSSTGTVPSNFSFGSKYQ